MKILEKIKHFWAWLRADRKRWIGAAVIILLLIFVFFRQASVNKNKVTYQTTAVKKGTIVSSVSASGQILTSNLVNVGTQATGVVKAVYVKNGDKIFVGQRIAEITLDSDGALANTKAWASLVSATGGYRSAQASLLNVYDQIKGHDSDESFAMIETRTKVEVASDNAWANLATAGLSYRLVSPVITAPMTGMIDNITLTPGMVLTNGSSSTAISSNRVAVITSQGNPIATFNVSEVDVSRVKQGQKATITLDSISDKTFTGKIMTVDKIGTVVSGVTNYPVTILFDTTAPEILSNMAATANIIIDSKDGVLEAPSSAIQTQTDGTPYVRILRNGQPQNVNIETGLSSDTETEIISGLSEGEEVIMGTSTGTSLQGGSTSPFSTFRVGGTGGGGAVRVGR